MMAYLRTFALYNTSLYTGKIQYISVCKRDSVYKQCAVNKLASTGLLLLRDVTDTVGLMFLFRWLPRGIVMNPIRKRERRYCEHSDVIVAKTILYQHRANFFITMPILRVG